MKNNDIKEKPEQLNYKNHHIEKIWNSFIVDFSCVWNLWPWFLAVLGGPSISQCLLHLDFLLLFCYTPFFSPTQFINWSRSYTNSFYTPFHYIAIYCDRINWLSSLKLDIYSTRIVGTDTHMYVQLGHTYVQVGHTFVRSGKTETAKNSRLDVAFRMFFWNFCRPIG